MTGPFDGPGQGALVFGAIAGNPPPDNLSLLRQELAETFHLFIINQSRRLFTAETADLLSKEATAGRFSLASSIRRTFGIHAQNGTSSSGESSSLEIGIGPSFFGGSGTSSAKGSSGS